MTIKTWEDRYNAPGIVSGHITDHMQAEITELRARVASDAITMMRLAGMSQDCALKAKGLEEHLEIAQGTLKNLWARVAELEAELATAKLAAKYAEHIDATPENQWQTMLHDALTERGLLTLQLALCRDSVPQGYATKWLDDAVADPGGVSGFVEAAFKELEAELATAKRGIECYAMQLAKDTVQSDIDCIMAQGVEIAQLKAELAAVRAQKPWAYFDEYGEVTKIESPTAFRLSALDNIQCLYLAAGAQPLCKFPTCHSVDYQDELCKSLEDGRIDVPKGWQIVRIDAAQPVPESKTIATAPECLNTNDKAFWATGWNECRKAMLAAAKESKCP